MQPSNIDVERPDVLVLVRVFDATPETLFAAWTEPALLARWFGPRSAQVLHCALDPRPGGALRFCHRFPDGMEVWVAGTYLEVQPPSRLVFTSTFTNAAGLPQAHPMFPDWPLNVVCTTSVTLEALGDQTQLTVEQRITPAEAAAREPIRSERRLAHEGWIETLERLAETVEPSL